jgi:Helix-turn-helix domain
MNKKAKKLDEECIDLMNWCERNWAERNALTDQRMEEAVWGVVIDKYRELTDDDLGDILLNTLDGVYSSDILPLPKMRPGRDEAIRCAVCKLTPMTVGTWEQLSPLLGERRPWLLAAIDAARAPKANPEQTADITKSSDIWADYRHGPDGPLLTTKYCKEELGLTAKDLNDPEAKKNHRKNPNGRKYGGDLVYRYTDVARIANRKPDPQPPSLGKLSELREKIRSERN